MVPGPVDITPKGTPVKLLIAADNSIYSRAALESVLTCPWPADTEFLVMSAVETEHERTDYWNPHSRHLLEEAEDKMMEDHQVLVESYAKEVKASFPTCQVDARVVEGRAVDKILEVAQGWGAELIVLGSHGLKGLTRFLLGSVSESVAAHADCSVRIVRLRSERS